MDENEFYQKFDSWLNDGVGMWVSLPELPPFAVESNEFTDGMGGNISTKNSMMCVLIGEKQYYIGFYSQIGNMEPFWRNCNGGMILDKILKWIPIPNHKQEETS